MPPIYAAVAYPWRRHKEKCIKADNDDDDDDEYSEHQKARSSVCAANVANKFDKTICIELMNAENALHTSTQGWLCRNE